MTKNKKQYNKNIGNTKAMGVGGWPHQLAQSKGRKQHFKLIIEMYNIYTFSKSITLAVGGHCECSPRNTEKPN